MGWTLAPVVYLLRLALLTNNVMGIVGLWFKCFLFIVHTHSVLGCSLTRHTECLYWVTPLFNSGTFRTGFSYFACAAWITPGRVLLNHKQEASCIYVNNVRPWNAITYLHYLGIDRHVLFCMSHFRMLSTIIMQLINSCWHVLPHVILLMCTLKIARSAWQNDF